MKELKDVIAENITYLRKLNKMTQLELAEKLNYSDKSISKWEHGETLPDIEVLTKIASLFNVKLEYLISEDSHEEKIKLYKKSQNKQNQIIISLLGISFIYIAAAVFFVYSNIILKANNWIIFLWALPLSAILLFYFNKLWGSRKNLFIIMSFFIWSLLLCLYLQFVQYNMLLLFLVAVPVQIAIILWSKLKI